MVLLVNSSSNQYRTIDRFEKHIKGFNYTAEIIEIIRECYLNSVDLSNATRKLVNILFQNMV